MESKARAATFPDNPTAHQLFVPGLFGLITLAVFIVYARLPAVDTYAVSATGLTGGASRMQVFTNFPLSFAAIALIGVVAHRVRIHSSRAKVQ